MNTVDEVQKHNTGIRWTHGSGYRGETWNPVIGCSKVSPGCAHCYAEQLSFSPKMRRFGYTGLPWTPANAQENVQLRPDRLAKPWHWQLPRMVFVNSMSDLFHELVPDDFIWEVFASMSASQRHIFQVLTKRPQRMMEMLSAPDALASMERAFDRLPDGWDSGLCEWPLPNVWVGTSVENQHFADIRIPLLLKTPAVVRFLSCEPLLGPVDLNKACWGLGTPRPSLEIQVRQIEPNGVGWSSGFTPLRAIDWVIVGGESGPGYRAMAVEWARDIRDVCLAADVPFFFKQSGGSRPETGQELDGQRWQQMPAV